VEEAEEHDEERQQMEEKKEEGEEEEEQGRPHSVRPYMAVREKPESMKKRGMILEAVLTSRKGKGGWERGREGGSERVKVNHLCKHALHISVSSSMSSHLQALLRLPTTYAHAASSLHA